MRVVLLTLSGDPKVASDALKARHDSAEVIAFPRPALENGRMFYRVSALQKLRPDIFAIMTESLAWQYGQDALMLFGALGGASESIVIDARRNIRSARRIALFLTGPLRILYSFVRGELAVRNASRMLGRLEHATRLPGGNASVNEHAASTESAPARRDLKITYLRATPSAGTQPGGATSHINGVIKALLGFGAHISFIGNDEIAGLDRSTVSFHKILPDNRVMPRAAFDIFNGWAFSAAASDLTAASPPDFIYQRYSRFSLAGVEASLRAKVPLFLEFNGSEVWVGKHWDKTEKLDLLEGYERLNLRAASRIFVISEVEKNNLLDAGVPAEKIIVNPNGVDPDEFRPDIGGDKVRGEIGIGPHKKLVGFVGTFGPWHGVLALAEAIALTPKNDDDIHFLFVGDGSLRAEVENKLRTSGDLDRVTFAGSVSHERVPALLDACDILVSPHVPLAGGSEFFGSPTKLFEYMASGKAIVASRLGQIADVLQDNENAVLVEPGNAKELSNAIVKLTADSDLLHRLGQAARAAAVANHTWRGNAARVLEAFRDLNAL
jgi:glycosyltransferase involved in cell wall biosynthesis